MGNGPAPVKGGGISEGMFNEITQKAMLAANEAAEAALQLSINQSKNNLMKTGGDDAKNNSRS